MDLVFREESELQTKCFQVLTDEWKPPEQDLPSTGVPLALEKVLSSIFVQGHAEFDYGTRCSTVVVRQNDTWHVEERTYQKPRDKGDPIRPRQDFDSRTFKL